MPTPPPSSPTNTPTPTATSTRFFGRGALESGVLFDGDRSNETLYLCYSSGTTGSPKGALLPPRAHRDSETHLSAHDAPCLASSFPGAEKGSATIVLVVLARHEAIEKHDMVLIRKFGGRPRYDHTHASPKLCGLAETSPTMTILHPDDANSYISSVGRVLPNFEVRPAHEDAGQVSATIVDRYMSVMGCRKSLRRWGQDMGSRTDDHEGVDTWVIRVRLRRRSPPMGGGSRQGTSLSATPRNINRRKELVKYKGCQGKWVRMASRACR
ncbi:hypothetical protein OG21DRAFT_1482812 [Imleria badia]|nr:hypothetical protein OG21DRAFT_1482812 [Imleria badia]